VAVRSYKCSAHLDEIITTLDDTILTLNDPRLATSFTSPRFTYMASGVWLSLERPWTGGYVFQKPTAIFFPCICIRYLVRAVRRLPENTFSLRVHSSIFSIVTLLLA
jgi:hypothetical protein